MPGLTDLDLPCQREVIVIECRVDDIMAVILQVGRLDAARDRTPAVEENNPQIQKRLTTIRRYKA